jgi:phosphopantetheine adenylyltransferase
VDLQKSLSTINKKLNNELAKLLLIKNEDVLFISKTYVSKNYLKYKDYNKMQADLFKKVQGTEFIHNII